MDGAATLGTAMLSGGAATFSTSGLAVTTHAITAVYGGDSNFTTSTSTALSQAVNQAATATALASSANPSVYGQSVTLTAAVSAMAPGSGTPTGTVTFMDGSATLGTGALSGGVATFSTSALAVGTHPVTAVYSGDTNFTTSTSTALSQAVDQATTATALASSANPSVYGQSVTLTASVSATSPGSGTPTGTVTFMDGPATLGTGTLSGGVATFTTGALSAAIHPVTAVYSGDTNFTTSTSNSLNQAVNQAGTTTTVVAAPSSGVYGQPVTFTATVSPAGTTGSVTFYDGDTALGTGSLDGTGNATFTTGALATGPHSITAVYSGDGNFQGDTSSALSFAVGKATPAVTVHDQDLYYGTPLENERLDGTASATINGVPTGVPGTFAYTAATGESLGAGMGQIESVTFTPNDTTDFNTVESIVTVNIAQAPPYVGVFPVSLTYGTPLDNSQINGRATWTVDGVVVLVPGTYAYTSAAGTCLGAGNGQVESVTFTPTDTANYTAVSVSAVVNVRSAPTTLAIATSSTGPVYGQVVTFTATAAPVAPGIGTPTGTVSFYDGASLLGTGTLGDSGNPAGTATFSTDLLSTTGHAITAVYSGDDNFTGRKSGQGVSLFVTKDGTTLAVSASANPSLENQPVTFTAMVTQAAPGGVSPDTGSVQFFVDGKPFASPVAVVEDVATLATSALPVGSHTVSAQYSDPLNNFKASTGQLPSREAIEAETSTTLTAGSPSLLYGQPESFTAWVSDTDGPTTPTGSVAFYVDGVLARSAALTGGSASYTTTLPVSASPHSVYAKYVPTSTFLASDTSATPLAIPVSPAPTLTTLNAVPGTTTYGTAVTLTANVSSPDTPAAVVGWVQFYDNGARLGGATAVSGGTATLELSGSALIVGAHSIQPRSSGPATLRQVTRPRARRLRSNRRRRLSRPPPR
jgi:hypothetical protein